MTSRDGLEWRNYSGTFYSHSDTQIAILLAIHDNLGHVLFELDAQLEHGVFTSELEQADLLKKNGHIRAAGAVGGVAVEGHLSGACKRKGIKLRKAKPTIADYNDALKADGHIETPTWRLIQRLADIRTYCVHKKEREPTEDEVLDLIRGAHKVLADIA